MTPEQLEAIEGIGPKTVEKISLAVNNYFASLEGGAVEGAPEGEAAAEGESALETAQMGTEDVTAEIAAVAEEPAASEEVAVPEEGTDEADMLASGADEKPEDPGDQTAPETESASETRE